MIACQELKQLKDLFYHCGECELITRKEYSDHFLKSDYKFSLVCNGEECKYVTQYNIIKENTTKPCIKKEW